MLGFTDYECDDDGDIVVADNGDISVADSRRTTAQDIATRVRTVLGEYLPDYNLGSSVAKMYGERNTEANGATILNMVREALSKDNRFNTSEYFLDVIPTSLESVAIIIVVKGPFYDVTDNDALYITFAMNYNEGTVEMIAGPDQAGSGSS